MSRARAGVGFPLPQPRGFSQNFLRPRKWINLNKIATQFKCLWPKHNQTLDIVDSARKHQNHKFEPLLNLNSTPIESIWGWKCEVERLISQTHFSFRKNWIDFLSSRWKSKKIILKRKSHKPNLILFYFMKLNWIFVWFFSTSSLLAFENWLIFSSHIFWSTKRTVKSVFKEWNW